DIPKYMPHGTSQRDSCHPVNAPFGIVSVAIKKFESQLQIAKDMSRRFGHVRTSPLHNGQISHEIQSDRTFSPDLSRDKSRHCLDGRACLPPAGAFRARPGSRAPIYVQRNWPISPCPPAYASGQSDLPKVHWTFGLRSSLRRTPSATGRQASFAPTAAPAPASDRAATQPGPVAVAGPGRRLTGGSSAAILPPKREVRIRACALSGRTQGVFRTARTRALRTDRLEPSQRRRPLFHELWLRRRRAAPRPRPAGRGRAVLRSALPRGCRPDRPEREARSRHRLRPWWWRLVPSALPRPAQHRRRRSLAPGDRVLQPRARAG